MKKIINSIKHFFTPFEKTEEGKKYIQEMAEGEKLGEEMSEKFGPSILEWYNEKTETENTTVSFRGDFRK